LRPVGVAERRDSFAAELDSLRALISQMGGIAEHGIRESMRCLMEGDRDGAAAVVAGDARLDALEAEAERRVVALIAAGPSAGEDLREALAALKIAGLVERIGDYAKNIAKRVPRIDCGRGRGAIEPLALLPAMARLAAEMVDHALNAYVGRDVAAAERVCARDRTLDDLYNSVFRALVGFMADDPASIGRAAHLLFVAKNLERIGDHATNVAEMVYFAGTGRRMPERRRGEDGIGPA
jgi:phosphate transport system protein